MSRADKDLKVFLVGSTDLEFLGLAAGFAARWHARRNDLPDNKDDAVTQVLTGLLEAWPVPLDEIGEVWIEVHADSASMDRIRALAKQENFNPLIDGDQEAP